MNEWELVPPGNGRTLTALTDSTPYLVAHNDDFQRYVEGQLLFQETNSWWFGWGKNHDPFDANFEPAEGDTVINYTQRRILWINDRILAANRVT